MSVLCTASISRRVFEVKCWICSRFLASVFSLSCFKCEFIELLKEKILHVKGYPVDNACDFQAFNERCKQRVINSVRGAI